MSARGLLVVASCAVLAAMVAGAAPVDSPASGPVAAYQAPLATKAPLLAIARAGSRLVAVGDYGVVVLSDDEGRTWRQAASVATREMLTAVTFVDARQGFAVGHGGALLQTTDAGETWTTNYAAGADSVLLSVYFDNAGHGIAVGAFGLALATNDGGRSWKAFIVGDGDDRDRHLNAIFALPGGPLLIAAEGGTVFRSTDAGRTWSALRLPYNGSLWGGIALRDGAALVYGMRGHALQSRDQGRTWVDAATGTDQSWSGGVELADGTIVLVGLGGAVATSTDGGKTFRTAIRPERQTFAAAISGASGQLVVVGLAGVGNHSFAAR